MYIDIHTSPGQYYGPAGGVYTKHYKMHAAAHELNM